MNGILTPKQAAVYDMRAAGLDTTILRKTVTVEEIEELISIDNGHVVNGRIIKRTTTSETIHL